MTSVALFVVYEKEDSTSWFSLLYNKIQEIQIEAFFVVKEQSKQIGLPKTTIT